MIICCFMSKSFYKLLFFIVAALLTFPTHFLHHTKNFKKLFPLAEINIYKIPLPEKDYAKTFAAITVSPENSTIKSEKRSTEISIAKNIAIIILAAALVGLCFYCKSKQKKQFSKFRNIIRNHYVQINKENNSEPVKEVVEPDFSNISVEEVFKKKDDHKKRNESLMTSETETKLLELLNDFEKGSLYNNKNMSLPFLAGELNTNTKYLSYIINQHKSADFKTYINRLRINYIIDKLINEEKYRQYKISILADECGFSSHSKFAAVFKAETDFSPSSYIKLLDSENQSDKHVHFQENN